MDFSCYFNYNFTRNLFRCSENVQVSGTKAKIDKLLLCQGRQQKKSLKNTFFFRAVYLNAYSKFQISHVSIKGLERMSYYGDTFESK